MGMNQLKFENNFLVNKNDEDLKLRNLVSGKLAEVKENMVREGNTGIVVKLDDKRCAKYYRFQYTPNEYDVLLEANRLGLAVPKVYEEYSDMHCFVMELLNGDNLEQLLKAGYKFPTDLIDMFEDDCRDFCRHFSHNDFGTRNIFVKNLKFDTDQPNRVVDCDFVIIDFDKTTVGASNEHQFARGWFKNNYYKEE